MSYGPTRLGDAQAQADAATYRAQHQAALDMIAARQAGDFTAYSAAQQRLFTLGITNATDANDADLQAIANEAALNAAKAGVTGFVGSLTGGLGVVALLLAALAFGPQLLAKARRAHG
jgi:hypothetical protein